MLFRSVMEPIIYDGVQEGMKLLSKEYKLFLLSNCEKDGLVNFINHTKINHIITDYMEHGMNLKPKHHNMQLLVEKHGLKSPVYVGDTDSDSVESSKAGVPFVYMTYGFGHTDNFSLKFDSFSDLVEYFFKTLLININKSHAISIYFNNHCSIFWGIDVNIIPH